MKFYTKCGKERYIQNCVNWKPERGHCSGCSNCMPDLYEKLGNLIPEGTVLNKIDLTGITPENAAEKIKPILDLAAQKIGEEIEKPSRYNKGKIEVWDFILDQSMGFLDGNVVKYICRYKQKNGIEDLKKARVYLDKLIKEEEKK